MRKKDYHSNTFTTVRNGFPQLLRNNWLILALLVLSAAGCKKIIEKPGTTGLCPEISVTNPINNAVNVFLNSRIVATFNEVMDSTTITAATFTLYDGTTPIAGYITASGMNATFTPAGNLKPLTRYTATMVAGVKDPAGNALPQDYIWTFTTGDTNHIAPPTVIATSPSNGDTGVALNKKITAVFSEVMDSVTISSSSFILRNGANTIGGSVSYTGVTTTFTPSANLIANTTYKGTITTAAKNLTGQALTRDYVWSFTTGNALDETPPTVIATDPAHNATGVLLNKLVSATFSEVIDPVTINALSFTLRQGTTAIPGNVTYSGTTAVFDPAANLSSNTVYTTTISTIVKDLAGNAMATNYVWNFTTINTADVTAPTVVSTDPTNGAIGVARNKQVTATFSEPMNSMTINTTSFTVRQGATPIPGSVSYSGLVARFIPNADFAYNKLYTATITTMATDVAGNPLTNNYVWTFTTELQVVPPPPMGIAATFGAFGGSAGVTNQGINTVINNGNLGTTGASTLITGFHDGTTNDIYTETPLNKGLVTGRIHTAPPPPGSAASFLIATNALADAVNAYNATSPASKPGGIDPGAGELGNLVLAPGIYKSASGTFNISNGNLTLDAQGDPNAVWIFQTAAGLTVGVAGPTGAKSVLMINGGQAKNVFWHVGSAATINSAGGGVMSGTIIASAGVTFSTAGNAVQTVLNGRALSLNASVTMVNTTINVQ